MIVVIVINDKNNNDKNNNWEIYGHVCLCACGYYTCALSVIDDEFESLVFCVFSF